MISYPLNSHPDFTNLKQLVDNNANHYTLDTAFQFQKNKQLVTVTYQSFRHDISALCEYFLQQGMNRASIAVLGENSYEWILTYFSVVMETA